MTTVTAPPPRASLVGFFVRGLREVTSGRPLYHAWMALLTLVMLVWDALGAREQSSGASASGAREEVPA